MAEKLIGFDKFNALITKVEIFKRIYLYMLENLPGLEITYIPDFTLRINYYRDNEEINDDFLTEECNRLKDELYLPITCFSVSGGEIELSI